MGSNHDSTLSNKNVFSYLATIMLRCARLKISIGTPYSSLADFFLVSGGFNLFIFLFSYCTMMHWNRKSS